MLTFKSLLMSGTEAVCIVDDKLAITQYNQNLSLLLNQTDIDLRGQNLSSIFYDNSVIRDLTKLDNENLWFQGECILKSNNELPLLVKFRAGKVWDDESQEILNVIVFSEIEEIKGIAYSRVIEALKLLLNFVLNPNHDIKNILTEFVKNYDRKAQAYILDTQLYNQNMEKSERDFISSKQAIMSIQMAIENKKAVMFQSDKLICFFPIYSEKNLYGIAYVKFSTTNIYNNEDMLLFNLCGRILGLVIENNIMIDRDNPLNPAFHIIFEKAKNPIIFVNSQGSIIMINNATKHLFGFAESEMIGRNLGNIIFPEESPHSYNNILENVMNGNTIQDIELPLLKSNLTMIDVVLSAYPHKKSDGTIIGAIFILENNEDKIRFKDKIIQWEKLSVLGELLHSAANELNNSLTSVIGHSEVLIQIENDNKIADTSSKIYKGAIRCSNIVKGLIDLAREDGYKMGYTSLDSIIRSALDLKLYQLRSNNIELHTELRENIPYISDDLHKIERIILHLINYAEKRMIEYSNGGKLGISVKLDEPYAIIEFTDTGTCILGVDDVNNMFASLSDNSFLDKDIDLIVSCQILKDIGGLIYIDSSIGNVNIITLKLPITNDLIVEPKKSRDDLFIGKSKVGKKILLVDDEADIVDLLTEYLQENEYIVEIARDGNEAMEKILKNNYDLIISDLKMPNGFTGSKLHGFIKRKNPSLAKRMIFMTGDIINKETQTFLQNTGNPYLEKPFLPESLIEIINQIDI